MYAPPPTSVDIPTMYGTPLMACLAAGSMMDHSLYVLEATGQIIVSHRRSYDSQYTPRLVDFLKSVGVITTHFVIGTNILFYPDVFKLVFEQGHDLAVHTWTHPYMTTLSNELIAAEVRYSTMIFSCRSFLTLIDRLDHATYL